MPKSKSIKLPALLPVWRAKAMWAGTAITMLIPAKDEVQAKERAWSKVARGQGGELCLGVRVLGQEVRQVGVVN